MQDDWDVATGLTGTEWVDSLFLQTAAMQSKSVRYSYCSHHVWNIESSEINFFKFRIIFGNLNFDHHRMRDGVYSHSFRIYEEVVVLIRYLKIWHRTEFLGAIPPSHRNSTPSHHLIKLAWGSWFKRYGLRGLSLIVENLVTINQNKLMYHTAALDIRIVISQCE